MDPVARAIAVALPSGEGDGPPEWIPLLPAGRLDARDGRQWLNDAPGAVLAATRERAGATDLTIDYEHQTDHAPQNGQPAPAAGWIREVAVRDGALWGRVEWTARAAAHIVAKEYRYISPTFAHDRAPPRRVRAVLRAALTNSPALDLPALAHTQEVAMTPEQLAALAAALGLAATATPEECVARAAALSGQLGPIAIALGLAATATPEECTAAARTRATPDLGQFVPRAEFDRVAGRLTTLETQRTEETATAAVDAAITAGKVAPAQRDWALAYARSDASGFETYVAGAPVIVAPGGIVSAGAPDAESTALTRAELEVCAAMGISQDAYVAARKADIARSQ